MTSLRVLYLVVFLLVPAGHAAEPARDKAGWKSLFDGKSLEGWKRAGFTREGKVEVKDGAIILGKGNPMTGIVCTWADFPKLDYEATFEGKKIEGDDFFGTTTFPFGDTFCSFVVGGWGGSTVGLSKVDGADAIENETYKSREFKRDRWYRVRIRVVKERIQCWIDEDKMVDLDTQDRTISVRIESAACKPFGIATYATIGAVRDVRVRSLSAEEVKAARKKEEEKK